MYSAVSTWLTVRPSAEILSRSRSTATLRVLDLQVAADVLEPGQSPHLLLERRRHAIQLLGVGVLQRELVALRVGRPPMLIGGGFDMNTRMPGILASFGRSSAMIWSTD